MEMVPDEFLENLRSTRAQILAGKEAWPAVTSPLEEEAWMDRVELQSRVVGRCEQVLAGQPVAQDELRSLRSSLASLERRDASSRTSDLAALVVALSDANARCA